MTATFNWGPTEKLIHGRIIKSFLPLKKHRQHHLTLNHYANLYPGDEVYIFEQTSDGKWCRGYLLWQPLPEDFIVNMSSYSEKLPEQKVQIVIFPKKFVHLFHGENVANMYFLKAPDPNDLKGSSVNHDLPTLYDLKDQLHFDFQIASQGNHPKPPFPYFKLQSGNLIDEIYSTLSSLGSHIYSMYSFGAYGITDGLIDLYYELDHIRLQLRYDLSTKDERQKAIMRATSMMCKISKYISSKNMTNLFERSTSKSHNTSGYTSIITRNKDTGELFSYEDCIPQVLSSDTLLYALTPTFPVKSPESSLKFQQNTQFSSTEPCQILVDLKEVKSDLGVKLNFHRLTACVYLTTNKRRLSEPFIVKINADKVLSIDTISAALFNNIPSTEIDSSRIYLVLFLVEEVDVDFNMKEDEFKAPFIPFKSTTESVIKSIRKGVAGGVADISRVFSRHKDSLSSNVFHEFTVKLFGSYISKEKQTLALPQIPTDPTDPAEFARLMQASLDDDNSSGWGELIDRIIADSNRGVAVNPRARSVVLAVKELQSHSSYLSNEKEHDYVNGSFAIQTIPTFFYDTLSNSIDRIYLSLDKVSLCDIDYRETNVKIITIQISSSNENITFRKGSNDLPRSKWLTLSVKPGESIGEYIRIDGINNMDKDETLRVSAYINGYLMAKSKFYIKRGNQIVEYERKSVFQLMSTANKPLVEVEIGTTYVGKTFNMERSIHDLLSIWRKFQYLDPGFESSVIEILNQLKTASVSQLIKYFNPLLIKLLELIYVVNVTNASRSSVSFKEATFSSLVRFLDMVVVRQDNYRHLYNDFINNFASGTKLPQVGPEIISMIGKYFSNFHQEWNHVGRALCRSTTLLLKLALISSTEVSIELRTSLDEFFTGLFSFFTFNKESVMTDQVLILDSFDIYISIVSKCYESPKLIGLLMTLFQACHNKEHAIGMDKHALSVKELKFVNSKLLLMRRCLQHELLKDYLFAVTTLNNERTLFLSRVIEWSIEPFLKYNGTDLEISSIRLANGVINTIVHNALDPVLQRNLIRLLPIFCRFFTMIRKYFKEKDLFKYKRSFTSLFPSNFPFTEISVDSMVNETIVSEVLIELASIISSITKIVERMYGANSSFVKVINDCAGDKHFTSVFYINSFAREDMLSVIYTVKQIIKGSFYPSSKWLSLTALYVRTSVVLLELCKDLFIKYKVPPFGSPLEDLDIPLWVQYLKTAMALANHKVSCAIKLAEIPRKAVSLIAGDIILRVANIIDDCANVLDLDTTNSEIWTRFGLARGNGYLRVLFKFSAPLVRELLVFAFQRHTMSRKVGSQLTWAIGVNVWFAYNSLQPAVDLSIPEFYHAYQSGQLKPTMEEVQDFTTALFYVARINPTDETFESFVTYIATYYEFLSLIAEQEGIPAGEEFDDDRTAHRIATFGCLLEANKPELFHNLINDLFIHNIKKKDYVQAALSLELLSTTYNWDPNDNLPAISHPPFPQQSSFERKEYLYKEAARNFARGLKLEKALSIYKDLANVYDKINYDLDGLSFVHGQISNLYTDLQSIDRLVPTYFKVSFIGFGFPKYMRGKVFIYEGLPFEYITSIHNRLMKLYPGSRIVTTQEEADELLVDPPMGKFLHVITVEPQLLISDEYATTDKKSNVNNKIRMYIENRDLNTFTCSRRLPGAKSVTDLWVKEFTYETCSTFPTLMNRSEIKECHEKKLSPLENAIKSLQIKIQDLTGLENMCYKLIKENGDYTEVFGELSRNISGTIDAPINGGVSQYREFLQNDSIKSQYKENELRLLQSGFDELAILLNRCLKLHAELCPAPLIKSHDLLQELYLKNFSTEIAKNKISTTNDTNDIISRMKSIQSSQQSFVNRQSGLVGHRSLISSRASVTSNGSDSRISAKFSVNDLASTVSHRTYKTSAAPVQGPKSYRAGRLDTSAKRGFAMGSNSSVW